MTALWRHKQRGWCEEQLTMPSVLSSTQKHSPHCSFEEEHHQIHPADVPWPSYCYTLHFHADRELWKRWDNACRSAQRPQKGMLLRSVSQATTLSVILDLLSLIFKNLTCPLLRRTVCASRTTYTFRESWLNLQSLSQHPGKQVLFGAIWFSEHWMCWYYRDKLPNKHTMSHMEHLLTGADMSSSSQAIELTKLYLITTFISWKLTRVASNQM